MKLSTTVNIYSLVENTNSPERMIEAARVCADAGFDAVDLYLKHLIELPEHELHIWIDKMLNTIAECGISISQCHLYFGKPDLDSLERHEECVAKSIRIADRMGIEWGVIHGIDYGTLCGVPAEENIRLNVESFKRLQKAAAPKTVGLAFENIMRTDFADPDVLIALCGEAGKYGKAGVCWDTGHANLSAGIVQGDAIRKLAGSLQCLHIHDNHGKFDEHVLPMMGTIDWKEIMHALREIGYERDFVYESAQPVKHLPEDDVLRKEFIKYAVSVGRYLLSH